MSKGGEQYETKYDVDGILLANFSPFYRVRDKVGAIRVIVEIEEHILLGSFFVVNEKEMRIIHEKIKVLFSKYGK